MNVYLRNKCMVNDLNIGGWNSSSCKMTKQRARERDWDSVQLISFSPFLSACALNRAVLPAVPTDFFMPVANIQTTSYAQLWQLFKVAYYQQTNIAQTCGLIVVMLC